MKSSDDCCMDFDYDIIHLGVDTEDVIVKCVRAMLLREWVASVLDLGPRMSY